MMKQNTIENNLNRKKYEGIPGDFLKILFMDAIICKKNIIL